MAAFKQTPAYEGFDGLTYHGFGSPLQMSAEVWMSFDRPGPKAKNGKTHGFISPLDSSCTKQTPVVMFN
jgi:hypothetical protein